MMVVIERENKRTFRDVEIGKPFILHEDGLDIVYIRTENFHVDMNEYNAVCLEDGTFEYFKSKDQVELFNDCQDIILK